MATCLTLPYFAPPDTLPAPIPSVSEILATKKSVPSNSYKNVIRIGEHYVAKYGKGVTLQEGQNMLFVKESTSVAVPTLYALFHDEDTGDNFIIMEYIPGRNLCWGAFDYDGKKAVVAQLRRYFDELRSLPSPGYYGGVWRQGTLDGYLTLKWEVNPEIHDNLKKPIDTEELWVETMAIVADKQYPAKPMHFDWLKSTLHAGLRNRPHDPVFTHADLDRRNIRVRDDGTVFLIDWEHAGWYPSYWEYCKVMMHAGFETDWWKWVNHFLDEYGPELGWMLLYREWIMWNGI